MHCVGQTQRLWSCNRVPHCHVTEHGETAPEAESPYRHCCRLLHSVGMTGQVSQAAYPTKLPAWPGAASPRSEATRSATLMAAIRRG